MKIKKSLYSNPVLKLHAKLKNFKVVYINRLLCEKPHLVSSEQGLREGGSGGTLYPGPGLGGPARVQVSVLSFGIAPQHRKQTCLQQKYQSAYSVLIIGRYFCYTAYRPSNSGRFDLKKKKLYQKPYTCIEINVWLYFSDLRALILQYNNVRGPTFPEIQKHFNLRERVKVDIGLLYYYH